MTYIVAIYFNNSSQSFTYDLVMYPCWQEIEQACMLWGEQADTTEEGGINHEIYKHTGNVSWYSSPVHSTPRMQSCYLLGS